MTSRVVRDPPAPGGVVALGRRSLVTLIVVLFAPAWGCDRFRNRSQESKPLPAGADPQKRRSAEPPGDPRIYQETRSYMGTLFRITVAMPGDARTTAGRETLKESRRRAAEAVRAGFREVARLEALLSPYRSGSAIWRINKAAAGSPTRRVKVGQEVFNLVHQSLRVSRSSGGAFDITFAPLERLWRFSGPGRGQVPGPAALKQALGLVGFKHVELDYDTPAIRLKKTGMRLGLGGIAKGYAVDQVARVLRHRGLSHFIVDGGGDLYVAGRHPDRNWRVGIKDPRKPSDYFASLPVTNKAVVTSGDYERYFMHRGRRYHHILDPRTGKPAAGLASVTVVARTGMLADALATAAFVLGPRAGYELLEEAESTEGLLVSVTGEVLVTPGLRGVVKARPPSKGP